MKKFILIYKKLLIYNVLFFKDHNFLFYAISLIEGDDSNSMGGTKIHDSFTVYLPRGMDRIAYYILFAHEHLHN